MPACDARPPRPAVVHGDYRLDNLVLEGGPGYQVCVGGGAGGAG